MQEEKITSTIKTAQQMSISCFIENLMRKVPQTGHVPIGASFVRNVATLYVPIGACPREPSEAVDTCGRPSSKKNGKRLDRGRLIQYIYCRACFSGQA
jgi:hypothetical protein